MEEWEQVEIEVVTDGLDASPSELHAAFEMSGDHLNEVRDRHTMMLVSSGEIPESHMAEIAPERRLNWIVDELNGKRHTNGLTIPLQGADASSIDLAKGDIDGHSILKLRVGENFVRNLPLPADIDSIKATLKGGVLDLSW
uniref:ArsA HSP20-like domain-containing protein n=1 Tax=uncultured organism MedDCM-OCT-S04-C1 TaxID=743604 RepID=D6PJM2_9ZZZZ|nr:hypothetical protein [uncultured organism MedDCM-OCT-S04-C1]